jgi:Flp pilus assembly protein TadD
MKQKLPNPAAPPADRPTSPARIRWGALLIAVAAIIAYANTFSVPFIFDDGDSIATNPTIRSLWPLTTVLNPPSPGYTVEARPVLNLTLALNFAAHGLNVRGYHVTNLAIHILAALTLYGLVRRTLAQHRADVSAEALAMSVGSGAGALARHSWGLALTTALLWAVHPLQTQAVTYTIQRAESLVGLLYLLTLYGALRGSTDTQHPRRWQAVAVAACALGMGVKEVIVAAPLVVLCYDRIFLSASWKRVFQQRAGFYLALAATWGVLIFCQTTLRGFRLEEGGIGQGPAAIIDWTRPGSAFDYLRSKLWADVTATPWSYLLAQSSVLLHYLRLSLWPDVLCLDYYWPVPQRLADVWLSMSIMTAALATVAWALVRHPRAGFLGLCFFLILAPSSSILPSEDPAFEHRMYLPLAAVLTALVLAMGLVWPRITAWVAPTTTATATTASRRRGAAVLVAILTVALTARSLVRNHDYRSDVAIWDSVVRVRPQNPRAYHARGVAFADRGQFAQAEADLSHLLTLEPGNGEGHASLGDVLVRQGRTAEAMRHYSEAAALRPKNVNVLVGLANLLVIEGRIAEAMPLYDRALRLEPHRPDTLSNLGIALCAQGKIAEAMPHLEEAVRLMPDNARSQNNLGRALLLLNRHADAARHLREAIRLQPDFEEAKRNLAEAQP